MKTSTVSEMKITPKQLEIAYKKLKACVYYDKTQIILRNKIIDYEKNLNYDPYKIKKNFNKICTILNDTEINRWENYTLRILNSIDVLYFPKELAKRPIIPINESSEPSEINKLQSFIDLDVEGQLLGILWIMKIGKFLDQKLYEHSYGNRLKMPKLQESSADIAYNFSPNLFAPYFLQYENWRDTALQKAKEIINGNYDAIILTMDFSRFYYSINISNNDKDEYYQLFKNANKQDDIGIKRLNSFIYSIIKKYSKKHDENCNRVFLPIGFFPSNIIANYCLKNFDDAILNQLNPSYYGRYVDDIIIVDKVTGSLSHCNDKYDIIRKFLGSNNYQKNDTADYISAKGNVGILLTKTKKSNQEDKASTTYSINPIFLNNKKSKIQIQEKKLKTFYFKKTGSSILIDKFRKTLYKNTSEFRYLPEENDGFDGGNYDEIFDLNSNDSINKFHSIENISMNKYSLSKFLGKRIRIRDLTNQPTKNQFDKDILKIFDSWNIIDNYNSWDKILQALILNDNFSLAEKFIKHIMTAIDDIRVNISPAFDDLYKKSDYTDDIKHTLLLHLQSAVCHNLALTYGLNVKDLINHLHSFEKTNTSHPEFLIFSYDILLEYRRGYCYSRMCDKYSMISSIDFVIFHDHTSPQIGTDLSDKTKFDLTHKDDFLSHVKEFKFDEQYLYYPYIITPQDLSIAYFLKNIREATIPYHTIDSSEMNKTIYDKFNKLNFNKLSPNPQKKLVQVLKKDDNTQNKLNLKHELSLKLYLNKINSSMDNNKSNFTIAIGNTLLKDTDFISTLRKNPIRTYERYKNVVKLINEAIKEKSDILILPESYLPLEWLPIVARTCAKNQLAIITGIEHIIYNNHVFNNKSHLAQYFVAVKPIEIPSLSRQIESDA